MEDNEASFDDEIEQMEKREETLPTQEVKKPYPELLMAIVTMSVKTLEDLPESKDIDVLYMFVKETLKHPNVRPPQGTIVPAIFAYYLEAYRAYHTYKEKAGKDDLKIYNEAALSIFDLYLDHPQDSALRQMLPMATEALHQILATYQRSISDRPMKEVIGDLMNVALLTQTVREYVKGNRRKKNYPYILWLRQFLKHTLDHPEKPIPEGDTSVCRVVEQVSKKYSTIVIPRGHCFS